MSRQDISRGITKLPSAGPYLAEITNHLDPSKMGAVEVSIISGLPENVSLQSNVFPVRYLSPFYGVTSARFQGNDANKFNDVQKSYGMWMVPPDIGTKVLVIFIDGMVNEGYWIGCVPDTFQNHMVPGIAATDKTALSLEQQRLYGTSYLPVAEFHKKSETLNTGPNIDNKLKPVHPFADRLLAQGLLFDDVRGTTTSGARREVPSQVFGISTPGPLDEKGPKAEIGYEKKRQAPISRLGGSQFVMDDGDINGKNELVRIRTRTGHQILLHNSQDLIYIGNAKGTTWIELTSNGKIDIYAADSISIHTEQDLNLKADRNINIEGQNVNIVSTQEMRLESLSDFSILSEKDINIQSLEDLSINSTDLNVKGQGSIKLESVETFDIKSDSLLKISSSGNLNLASDSDILQKSKNFHIKADEDGFITTGGQIHNNGAPASDAEIADSAEDISVSSLPRWTLPNRSIGAWNGNYFAASEIYTTLTRVPTHEPYDQHEDKSPATYSPANLDQNRDGGPASQTAGGAASNVKKQFKLKPNILGTPPPPTGNVEQDNIQAFLWTIRAAEGTAYPQGYQAQWPSREFDVTSPTLPNGDVNPAFAFKDHPNELRRANGIPSTAAGAYQFLYRTWKDCQRELNLPDFKPDSQDKAAIYLLALNNSLDDIKAGNFETALYKNRKTWASLPGANYPGQSMRSNSFLLAAYRSAGGKVA